MGKRRSSMVQKGLLSPLKEIILIAALLLLLLHLPIKGEENESKNNPPSSGNFCHVLHG